MKDNDRQHSKKGLHNIEIGISFCPLGFSLSGISAGYFHIAFFRFYQVKQVLQSKQRGSCQKTIALQFAPTLLNSTSEFCISCSEKRP